MGGENDIIPFKELMFLPELPEEVLVRFLMRYIKILIKPLAAAALALALLEVLLSIELQGSFPGGIDVSASHYLTGLIWTLGIAIALAVARGVLSVSP